MLTSDPRLALALIIVAFALKHYLGDFQLQTSAIARGKAAATGWLAPLAFHAAIHGAGTLLLALLVAPHLWWLALVDFAAHGAIDRAKSLISLRMDATPDESRYWWLFGFDQFLHHVTNVALAVALVML